MKRLLTVVTLAVSLIAISSFKNTASAQVGVGVNISYQDFYDELSPYGEWMDYPEHGYVWVPRMGSDFQPYRTGGHWAWSEDYEWMWVSDYNWGWAPFHYGRWFMDPVYGWMWVPGYEWSPGWVAWRDGGDYYGWAPLRPGISISIGFGNYNPPVDYWSFAPRRYISSPKIYNYCVPRQQNVTIINHTTIINNYNRRTNVFVSNGPRRYDAERYSGRINPVRVREINTPGRSRIRGNEISVYRPGIRRENDRNFAPRTFERYDRNGGNNNIARRNENNLPSGRQRDESVERRESNNNTINDRRGNMPERNREVNPAQPGNDRPDGNDRNRNRSQEQPNFERRTIDRNSNNNGSIEQPGRRRGERPGAIERTNTDRPAPSENRRMEQPRQRMEQPQQRMEQPQERRNMNMPSQQQQPNRSFERQQERRSAPSQQQPGRNIERQQERRSAPSQQQPNRSIERQQERRTDNSSRGQQPSREARGGDRGNRRF